MIGFRIFLWRISIGKPYMIKLNSSGTVRPLSDKRLSDFRRGVEKFEDTLGGRHCRLQDIVFFAQILNGPKEALRVLHERDQHSKSGHIPDQMKRDQRLR